MKHQTNNQGTVGTLLTLETICRGLIVLLFVYAGVSKLLDLTSFRTALNNQPFPNQFTPYLMIIVPTSELLVALVLVVNKKGNLGFYISALMMLVFTLYTAAIYFNAFSYIPCSCGGVLQTLSWTQHLLLNLFFLMICIFGCVIERVRLAKEAKHEHQLPNRYL